MSDWYNYEWILTSDVPYIYTQLLFLHLFLHDMQIFVTHAVCCFKNNNATPRIPGKPILTKSHSLSYLRGITLLSI